MLIRAANALGIIFLLGAGWILCAHALGWDNASPAEAAVFGIVVYGGFRAINR